MSFSHELVYTFIDFSTGVKTPQGGLRRVVHDAERRIRLNDPVDVCYVLSIAWITVVLQRIPLEFRFLW